MFPAKNWTSKSPPPHKHKLLKLLDSALDTGGGTWSQVTAPVWSGYSPRARLKETFGTSSLEETLRQTLDTPFQSCPGAPWCSPGAGKTKTWQCFCPSMQNLIYGLKTDEWFSLKAFSFRVLSVVKIIGDFSKVTVPQALKGWLCVFYTGWVEDQRPAHLPVLWCSLASPKNPSQVHRSLCLLPRGV